MTLARYLLKGIDLASHKAPVAFKHTDFPTLDPFLALLLKVKAQRRMPALHSLSVEDARAIYVTETAKIKANFKVKKVEDIEIPIAKTTLDARAYYPKQRKNLELLVYFHGGGGVIGDLDTHDDLCRLICQKSNMVVVSVAYRLAPEFPSPIGHQDAFEASEWLYHHRYQFGVSSNGISVAGDSAGGNIAIYTAIELAKQNIPVFGQLLFYPSADFSQTYHSEEIFATGLFLDLADRDWFQSHCMQGIALNDPRISPLLNPDLNRLPKTVIRTAELDVLRDEAEALVSKLHQEGVNVNFKREIGVGHAYGNLVGVSRVSYDAVVEAIDSFRVILKFK